MDKGTEAWIDGWTVQTAHRDAKLRLKINVIKTVKAHCCKRALLVLNIEVVQEG